MMTFYRQRRHRRLQVEAQITRHHSSRMCKL
jgi:hypothetical protein